MFPLHTDTAHWFRPARYVVLACVAPGRGARKTQLLHWDSLNLTNADCESIRNGVFQIVRGKQSFLSQIIDHRLGFIRVDFQCMVPFGNIARDAQLCVETAVQVSPKIEIDWAQGRILIIDNWRILHGRASSKEEDSDRELIRVLIEEIR